MADNNPNQRSWLGSTMSNMFGSVRRGAAAPATSSSTSASSFSASNPSKQSDRPIQSTEPNRTKASKPSPPQAVTQTPSRTFRPPSGSPESEIEDLARKASPASMAHRKLFQRPEKITKPKATNFNSYTFQTGIFRNSVAQADGTQLPFAFKPRVPPNTQQIKFPRTNPTKPMRSTTAQVQGRSLDKVDSGHHFKMNIPEPDSALTGETLSKKAPVNSIRSVYADEYMAHLCPSAFTDEQRRQFFCILDLRRLKFVADETMRKKDWRINMSNFAREYEKCRGLIMLRYGLYQFKTVSNDVLRKWKADNKVQDEEEEPLEPFRAVKPTAQSVADKARAGKRKAQDDLQSKPSSDAAHISQNKRSRPSEKEPEREPLAETTTPALNKGKRKAYVSDEVEDDEAPPIQSTKAKSATRAFFEKVANTPHKDKGKAPETASAEIPKPTSAIPASTVPSANKTTPAPKAPKQTLEHSVFNSSLKPTPAAGANIFGYLSDASSAKGSGNDNADADAEGTSGSEAEPQDASQSDEPSVVTSGGIGTPLPGPSLFGAKASANTGASSASSESSTAAPGKSLFDRIKKSSDGNLLRASSEQIESVPSQLVPDNKAAMIEKQITAASTFRTWTPDTPIKFAASTIQAQPLFGSAAPAVAPAGISPQKVPGTALVSNGTKGESTENAAAPITTKPSTFGFLNKPTVSESEGRSPKRSATESESEERPAKKSNLFGSSTPAFGASTGSMFGVTAKPTGSESEERPTKRSATEAESDEHPAKRSHAFGSSTPAFGAPTGSLLGSTAKPPTSTITESSAPSPFKPAVFSGFSAQNTAASALSAMSTSASQSTSAVPSASDDKPSEQSKTLFSVPKSVEIKFTNADSNLAAPVVENAAAPVAPQPATSVFGQPAASSMFGQSTQPADSNAASVFVQNAQPATPIFFGQKPQGAAANTPNVFGQSAQPATSTFNIFGQSSAPATSNAANVMGQNAQPVPTDAATVFAQNLNSSSMFTKSSQGATPNPASVFEQNAQPAAPSAFTMFGQPAAPAASHASSIFGQTSATPTPSVFVQSAAPAGSSSAPTFAFGSNQPQNNAASVFAPQAGAPSFSFSSNQGNAPQSGPPSFDFSNNQNNAPSFGGNGASSAGSSFTFATGGISSSKTSGDTQDRATKMKTMWGTVEDHSVPLFADPQQTQNAFTGAISGMAGNPPIFNFTQPSGTDTQNGGTMFTAGNTTGTNTPFTLGGASSLATTPATGTPEPTATHEQGSENTEADGEEKQAQINLTDGAGPGEEDEEVVHEVRAKALRLKPSSEGSGSEENDTKSTSPWKIMGVGPLRLLKHKTTGVARLLLRAEPRGHVALNKAVLPNFNYKPEGAGKYVKITVSSDNGKGLETWMLQVKTKDMAQALADALEANKAAAKK